MLTYRLPFLAHHVSAPFPNACLTGCSLAGRLGFSDPVRLSSTGEVDAARADLPLCSVLQVYNLAYSTFQRPRRLVLPDTYPRSGRPASFLFGGVIGLRYICKATIDVYIRGAVRDMAILPCHQSVICVALTKIAHHSQRRYQSCFCCRRSKGRSSYRSWPGGQHMD